MAPGTTSTDWQQRLGALWAEGIPLAGAMGVRIRRLDAQTLEVTAPLAPNRNHMGNAFGGSLQALATLAGWGVTLIASGDPDAHHVVIRDARMRFLAPVFGELSAVATRPSADAVAAFHATLTARGRARLAVPVIIRGAGEAVAARFVGEFVALARAGTSAPGQKPAA